MGLEKKPVSPTSMGTNGKTSTADSPMSKVMTINSKKYSPKALSPFMPPPYPIAAM